MDSIWVRVLSKHGGVVGYMEKYLHPSGRSMTIPGVSRWIEGAEFDLSKAQVL